MAYNKVWRDDNAGPDYNDVRSFFIYVLYFRTDIDTTESLLNEVEKEGKHTTKR